MKGEVELAPMQAPSRIFGAMYHASHIPVRITRCSSGPCFELSSKNIKETLTEVSHAC